MEYFRENGKRELKLKLEEVELKKKDIEKREQEKERRWEIKKKQQVFNEKECEARIARDREITVLLSIVTAATAATTSNATAKSASVGLYATFYRQINFI